MEDCDICDNKRYTQKEMLFYPCKCLLEDRFTSKLRESGMHEEFDDISYDMLKKRWSKDKEKIKRFNKFIEYSERILVKKTKHYNKPIIVIGKDGSDKVSLVACFLKDCLSNKKTTFITSLSEIIEQNFNEDKVDRSKFFDKVYHNDILCLKIGHERTHAMNNEMLAKVCNIRRNKKKYIIFCSKPRDPNFEEFYGEIGKYLDNREKMII